MAIEQQRDALTRAGEILARIDVHRDLLIGGRWTPSADGGRLPVVDPSTGREVTDVAGAGERDVDAAVEAGRHAFDEGTWSRMAPAARARALNTFADAIEARTDDLYQLETLCNGRPIAETRAQLGRLPEWYRYNAALLMADRTDVIPMPGPYHTYTSRFPIGVVGILSSFNHPMMIGSKSLAPALATGNSVVLKPSELTPLTSLLLGQIGLESGVPAGVLNVAPGIGSIAGARLAANPNVGKITFTGGTAAGRAVARAAAERFAKVTVELGGKTPVMVFDDVDIETAAKGVAFGAFVAAGQTCICGSRLLVHRSIHDEFVEALVAIARSIRIGDPFEPDTQLGPLISQAARERVLGYVELGVEEGGTIAAGGAAPNVAGLEGGFFVEPTVITGLTNESRCAAKRSSAPWRWSCRSRTRRTPCARRTTRPTASDPRSGRAMSLARTAWRPASPTGSCGSTIITGSTPRRRGAASATAAAGGKGAGSRSTTSRTCARSPCGPRPKGSTGTAARRPG